MCKSLELSKNFFNLIKNEDFKSISHFDNLDSVYDYNGNNALMIFAEHIFNHEKSKKVEALKAFEVLCNVSDLGHTNFWLDNVLHHIAYRAINYPQLSINEVWNIMDILQQKDKGHLNKEQHNLNGKPPAYYLFSQSVSSEFGSETIYPKPQDRKISSKILDFFLSHQSFKKMGSESHFEHMLFSSIHENLPNVDLFFDYFKKQPHEDKFYQLVKIIRMRKVDGENSKTFQRLLEYMDINYQDKNGMTLLHYAVLTNKNNPLEMLKSLNTAGAKILENHYGMNPFDIYKYKNLEDNDELQAINNLLTSWTEKSVLEKEKNKNNIKAKVL